MNIDIIHEPGVGSIARPIYLQSSAMLRTRYGVTVAPCVREDLSAILDLVMGLLLKRWFCVLYELVCYQLFDVSSQSHVLMPAASGLLQCNMK